MQLARVFLGEFFLRESYSVPESCLTMPPV
jgi:hypothetical protein